MRWFTRLMKLVALASIVALGAIAVFPVAVASDEDVRTVDYRDIPDRVKILGKLRHPLGELVTIRGQWIHIEGPKPSGNVFLVSHVDGRALDPPVEFSDVAPIAGSGSRIKRGEFWEYRGVEKGEFVGFSAEVQAEVDRKFPKRYVASPAPGGGQFFTSFYYVTAARLAHAAKP
jgi:hypothetical protein